MKARMRAGDARELGVDKNEATIDEIKGNAQIACETGEEPKCRIDILNEVNLLDELGADAHPDVLYEGSHIVELSGFDEVELHPVDRDKNTVQSPAPDRELTDGLGDNSFLYDSGYNLAMCRHESEDGDTDKLVCGAL